MMKIIQPYHYTGNKARQIKQIIEEMPEGCPNKIYDVFGGSGVVGLSAAYQYKTDLVYNDFSPQISKLFSDLVVDLFGQTDSEELRKVITETAAHYPSDKHGFVALKEAYNGLIKLPSAMRPPHTDSLLLLLLTTRSFNNSVRFAKKTGNFNYTYGERDHLDVDRIIDAIDLVAEIKNITATQESFEVAMDKAQPGDFVFIDPPYSGTDATYNSIWSDKQDELMYARMTDMTSRGVNWMMTNVIENRGKRNENLCAYIKANPNLRQVETGVDYSNSSHRKSSSKSKEIILVNY
jgi:site-specific DNA-adenine methylase